MTNKIWRLVSLGIWKETTAWTEASTFAWVPLTIAPFIKPINEYINNENGIWRIEAISWQELSRSESESAMEWWVWTETFWHLLTAWFWSATAPTLIETWVYKHSFSILNSNNHQSYSIITDWNTQNLSLYNLLDNLAISAEVWDVVKFTSLFKWKAVTTTTWKSVSFVSENNFKIANMTVKFATNIAWLWAATWVCLQSVNFELAKNVMSIFCAWSIEPNSLHNQQLELTGDFEALFTDDTYKDYVTGWINRAMRITIISDTLIWATKYAELNFDFANINFSEWDRSTDNNSIMTQTVWFTAWYSILDTSMITAYIQNTQSTTY